MIDSVPAYREQRIIPQFVHLFESHAFALIREDPGGYEFFEAWQLGSDSGIHGVRVGLEREKSRSQFLDSFFPLQTT